MRLLPTAAPAGWRGLPTMRRLHQGVTSKPKSAHGLHAQLLAITNLSTKTGQQHTDFAFQLPSTVRISEAVQRTRASVLKQHVHDSLHYLAQDQHELSKIAEQSSSPCVR